MCHTNDDFEGRCLCSWLALWLWRRYTIIQPTSWRTCPLGYPPQESSGAFGSKQLLYVEKDQPEMQLHCKEEAGIPNAIASALICHTACWTSVTELLQNNWRTVLPGSIPDRNANSVLGLWSNYFDHTYHTYQSIFPEIILYWVISLNVSLAQNVANIQKKSRKTRCPNTQHNACVFLASHRTSFWN